MRGFAFFFFISIISLNQGQIMANTPANRPELKTSKNNLSSSSPSSELEKIREQLLQETAQIQIQGRTLTEDELKRLKTVNEAIDQINKAIESLKKEKL